MVDHKDFKYQGVTTFSKILMVVLQLSARTDEVFDRFVFGILDLAEDGLTATKLVGLGNTTKIIKIDSF